MPPNPSIIDHISITVTPTSYEEVVNFYLAALQPLGIEKTYEFPHGVVGLGANKSSEFWIAKTQPPGEEDGVMRNGHIAFACHDRKTVDAIHSAALKAGGTCNGPPGLRKYHPNYYGAFLVDPVGNRIEAVCHAQEEAA